MTDTSFTKDQYAADRDLTLRNRAGLTGNQNLLYWYQELYRVQFAGCGDLTRLRILEIGSGVSPLKHFHDNVLTSDILELDYLDYVFDCHSIDRFDPIANESLDVIALTNVLHHLQSPIDFLNKAARKLKRNGKIIAMEPYFSLLSTYIFKYLHHEPVDFDIAEPVLAEVRGPLESANIALPWLIFFKHPEWRDRLRDSYDFDQRDFPTFTSISYMATGGDFSSSTTSRVDLPGIVSLGPDTQPRATRTTRLFLHSHFNPQVMSAAARLGRRFGNQLYRVAFPVYRPLYSTFKAYADRAERRLLAAWLTPGAVVVDAGANIGIYSRFLAGCVGPTGAVHSFEPSPENFGHLRDLLSRFPNVRTNHMAVSDRTVESLLYLSDNLNVDHRAYSTESEPRRTVAVQFTRLDDYFTTGARVDFIKMDIQGFELHALRGAERILMENPQIQLQIEFWPYGLCQAGESPEAIMSFLQNRDLHASGFKEGNLIEFDFSTSDPSDPTSYTNLFVKR